MTALKTAFFILLVPGFLLGYVPALLIPKIGGLALPGGFWIWSAIPLWLAGIFIMLWCARDFVVKGRGTPAPLDPPRELVVTGLYRYVRNPMYVGALLIQAGMIVWFSSLAQVVYWLFLFIGFNLFIRANEEPHLRKTFGAAYEDYCRNVPRWIPRMRTFGNSILPQINADEHRFLAEQVRFGIFKPEKDTLPPFIGQNQCLSVFICG